MNHYTSKHQRLTAVSILLLLLSSISLTAQVHVQEYFTISLDLVTDLAAISPTSSSNSSKTEEQPTPRFFTASADVELTQKGSEPEEIPSYFRQHKDFPTKFSGYVIELLQSENKLARNYPLFERYGNIHVQQLPDGKYSYCIIADFKKLNRVKIFAKEVIQPQVPDASIWSYRRGKRKRM